MAAWLKGGLVGIVILIVLNLVGLIPFLGCITAPLSLAAYVVVGLLAASYMPPKRETGTAAGQGALAAIVAGYHKELFTLFLIGFKLQPLLSRYNI